MEAVVVHSSDNDSDFDWIFDADSSSMKNLRTAKNCMKKYSIKVFM